MLAGLLFWVPMLYCAVFFAYVTFYNGISDAGRKRSSSPYRAAMGLTPSTLQ
jgi:hypothetical protein